MCRLRTPICWLIILTLAALLTPIPARAQQPTGPDLAAEEIAIEALPPESGGVFVIITVRVVNLGAVATSPTDVEAGLAMESSPQARTRADLPRLAPGEEFIANLRLEVLPHWAGRELIFFAEADPDRRINDVRRQNNVIFSEPVLIPEPEGTGDDTQPPTEEPPPEPTGEEPPPAQPIEVDTRPANRRSLALLVALIGAAGAVGMGALALIVRSAALGAERRAWQARAREEPPPDSCPPPQRYCQVEHEVDLKPMRITAISLETREPEVGTVRRRDFLQGALPEALQAAIAARRSRREHPQQIEARITALAHDLAGALSRFVRSERGPCDVEVRAHLEGIEVTSTFTLYRCQARGGKRGWKQVAQWSARKQQQRDDSILTLLALDPAMTSLERRLEDTLVGLLSQFVVRY